MSQLNNIGYIIHEKVSHHDKYKIIKESTNRVIAEAIVQDGEVENRNGRSYHTKDLAREISSPRTVELVNAKEFKGECGHPVDTSLSRQQIIYPPNVCCRYNKIWMDGNLVKVHVQGTNNALGEEFDADLREGGSKAFSGRFLGSIVNEKGRMWVTSLKLITYDYVIYCSHKIAYTTGIVAESAGLNKINGNYINMNDKGLLVPITNESVNSYVKSESANLKNVFNTFDTLCDSMSIVEGNKVRLVSKSGDILMINLESYISNEIMDYCSK